MTRINSHFTSEEQCIIVFMLPCAMTAKAIVAEHSYYDPKWVINEEQGMNFNIKGYFAAIFIGIKTCTFMHEYCK